MLKISEKGGQRNKMGFFQKITKKQPSAQIPELPPIQQPVQKPQESTLTEVGLPAEIQPIQSAPIPDPEPIAQKPLIPKPESYDEYVEEDEIKSIDKQLQKAETPSEEYMDLTEPAPQPQQQVQNPPTMQSQELVKDKDVEKFVEQQQQKLQEEFTPEEPLPEEAPIGLNEDQINNALSALNQRIKNIESWIFRFSNS